MPTPEEAVKGYAGAWLDPDEAEHRRILKHAGEVEFVGPSVSERREFEDRHPCPSDGHSPN